MSFSFETFDRRVGRMSKVPEVTIQSSGSVSMNVAAATLIGVPAAVELLYDREQQVFGIRGVVGEPAHAYPLRQVKNRMTYLVACKAFFGYYDIPLPRSVRREVRAEDGVLIVDLKDPGRAASATPRGSTSVLPRTPASEPLAG
jgi:hypothetical protein